MAKKSKSADETSVAAAEPTNGAPVSDQLREPAEVRYADQLAALALHD